MGHYPDYSWLMFKYPAAWLPKDQDILERDNPTEYNQAWKWLSYAMSLCLDEQGMPQDTPEEIIDVMSHWHELNCTKLEAVSKSEDLWRETTLGKKLPTRWNPMDREEFGLYDGLAVTRHGYINVVQDSRLHYMELASAIHYQFCYEHFQYSHYTWKPAVART